MSKSVTKRLCELLDERGVEWWESRAYGDGTVYTFWKSPTFGRVLATENDDGKTLFMACLNNLDLTPEQAIAATLGDGKLTAERIMAIAGRHQPDYCSDTHVCFDWQAIADELNAMLSERIGKPATLGKEMAGKTSPPKGGPGPCGQPSDDIVHDAVAPGNRKAKAHPYGYEPDTGAFDVTRCECGCLNDISATYCNDCGGVIEIDMNAEKEIYHTPRHSVFAEKHDDGSLEFGGKRYVAETPGSGKLTVEQVGGAIERNVMKVAVIDDGKKEVEWREGWVCRVGFDYKAIADELNAALGGEGERR